MYFKVTKDSDTGKKLADVYNRGREAWNRRIEVVEELMEEYPSMTGKFREPGGFVIWGGVHSLLFSEEPDPSVWHHIVDNEYMPLDFTDGGSKIAAKLNALPRVKYTEINACFDHHDIHHVIGFKVGEDHFGFEVDPKWEIKIPEDAVEITYTEFSNL